MKAVNRIKHLLHNVEKPPQHIKKFDDTAACNLTLQYVRNPAALQCPHCRSFTIYVMAFIEARTGKNSDHVIVDPVGDYAAALYCYGCQHGIAIVVPQ